MISPLSVLSLMLLVLFRLESTQIDRRNVIASVCEIGIGTTVPTIASARNMETIDINNDGSAATTTTSSDLYLARPMGPPRKDGNNGITVPSAPLEYLLPAARVGIYIYEAVAAAEDLVASLSPSRGDTANDIRDTKATETAANTLEALLLTPPTFVKRADPAVSRRDPYNNSPPIVGEVVAAFMKDRERKERYVDVGLAPRFFEVGELVGERRAWNRIVRAEQAREDTSEVRRAFNIYTTNLEFNPNRYQFSGTREEKSTLIRQERLPTTASVIRSDLDARDLYRNAVQTALEDARAEYTYQKKKCAGNIQEFDASELLVLLKEAQTNTDKWFSFIPNNDVEEALRVVKQE